MHLVGPRRNLFIRPPPQHPVTLSARSKRCVSHCSSAPSVLLINSRALKELSFTQIARRPMSPLTLSTISSIHSFDMNISEAFNTVMVSLEFIPLK